ncbi:MAG: hypothetical protein RLP44_27110 [Aggregatilineales bacterium]
MNKKNWVIKMVIVASIGMTTIGASAQTLGVAPANHDTVSTRTVPEPENETRKEDPAPSYYGGYVAVNEDA